MTKDKQAAISGVEKKAALIGVVADCIWDYAELSLQEERSAAKYCAVLEAEGFGDLVFVNQAESSGALADARALAELLERPVLAGSLWRGEYVPCWS